MKVAIITLHRVYNYGSVLQAYATQKLFEGQGHEVTVIDYITPQRTKQRMFKTHSGRKEVKGIRNGIYHILKVGSLLLKEATFGRFMKKNLHLTKQYVTVTDLERDPPEADLYVTGSDQVWNSKYNEGVDRGFFLDFLPEESRRISFVSSFGKQELDRAEADEVKKYISRYKALSVREDSAEKILNDLGRLDTVHLIDPTLQISKEEWVALASKRLIKERYLILMLLYNEDNHATEYARKIADEKGLKLVKISWELRTPPMVDKLMTHRTPAEFLSLFHYADFVVTNSFHGLVFSINLEKEFIVVPRNEFNSRIESLLRLTGLQRRMISNIKDLGVINEEINYTKVQEIISVERKRAREFIQTYM